MSQTTPPGLAPEWGEDTLSLHVTPLKIDASRLRHALVLTFVRSYAVLAVCAAMFTLVEVGLGLPLMASRLLGGLALGVPAITTALNFARHRSSTLSLTLTPQTLCLSHRVFGLPFGTHTVDLSDVLNASSDGQRLQIRLRSGKLLREPLPALDPLAVTWIAETIEQARTANADFWRNQLTNTQAHAAIQALISES